MATQIDSWSFTATGDGAWKPRVPRVFTYCLDVAGTGAVSATVEIYARPAAGASAVLLGTLTASGTTTASDPTPITPDTSWADHYAKCTAISGTSAVATVSASGGV